MGDETSTGHLLRDMRLAAGFSKLDAMVRHFKAVPDVPFQDKSTISRWESGRVSPSREVLEWYASALPEQSAGLRRYLAETEFRCDHFSMRVSIALDSVGAEVIRDESYHDVNVKAKLYYAVCGTNEARLHVIRNLSGLYASLKVESPIRFVDSELSRTFAYNDLEGDLISEQKSGSLVPVQKDSYADLLGPTESKLADEIHLFEMVFDGAQGRRRIVSDTTYTHSPSGVQMWRALGSYRSASMQVEIESSDPAVLRSVDGAAFIPDATFVIDRSSGPRRAVVRVMATRPFSRGHGLIVTWDIPTARSR